MDNYDVNIGVDDLVGVSKVCIIHNKKIGSIDPGNLDKGH